MQSLTPMILDLNTERQIDALNFINSEVIRLNGYFQAMWWKSSSEFPSLKCHHSRVDHSMNDRALGTTIQKMDTAMQEQARLGILDDSSVRNCMHELAADFTRQVLGFEDRHINLIFDHGFLDVAGEFAHQARQMVPSISDDDIYQAGRNVMTMNFMQLLLGQKVRLTPSILAYSLLYPLTDNFLDDPKISKEAKQNYGVRFRSRLEGEVVCPANKQEEPIWNCIQTIENEYPLEANPLVHASLLAIHDAQQRSLALLHKSSSPYEVDVLGLTFEKGGAAVLADGYLVAGDLTEQQREFMFAYGAFTQLMDDLEDTATDRKGGVLTLFSQLAGHWDLDSITNRLFHFGVSAFESVNYFEGPQVDVLKEMIWKCIDPLLIDFASHNPKYYSSGYLKKLEQHFPFSYTGLKTHRSRLERKQFHMMALVRAFSKPTPDN
jgi:hypothetical protein